MNPSNHLAFFVFKLILKSNKLLIRMEIIFYYGIHFIILNIQPNKFEIKFKCDKNDKKIVTIMKSFSSKNDFLFQNERKTYNLIKTYYFPSIYTSSQIFLTHFNLI